MYILSPALPLNISSKHQAMPLQAAGPPLPAPGLRCSRPGKFCLVPLRAAARRCGRGCRVTQPQTVLLLKH